MPGRKRSTVPSAAKFAATLCLALAGWQAPAPRANAAEFAAAGIPIELAKSRDYVRIFSYLKSNGINVFFPTFQYTEAPEALSLGFETDFIAPCTPDGPAFQALRETGMKILLPADLFYPRGSGLPSLGNDPVAQLIDCAGREQIYGVSNYDEPAFQGIKLKEVKSLYNRIKEIDSTLPVLMVHGPLVLDKPEFASQEQRDEYLGNVAAYSEFADIVGFDVYPVTTETAKVGSPQSQGVIVGYDEAIPGYISWLRDNLPGKQHLMVYQGFSFVDMFERNYLNTLISPDEQQAIRPPNRKELSSMISAAISADLSLVVFWGQGMLQSIEQAPWPSIVEITRGLKR